MGGVFTYLTPISVFFGGGCKIFKLQPGQDHRQAACHDIID
jgi:hypothetical protein